MSNQTKKLTERRALEGFNAQAERHLVARAYGSAIGLQDACNLSGVARKFPDLLDIVRDDLRAVGWEGTNFVAWHPVTILVTSKLHDLARLGLSDMTRYGLAYDLAMKVFMGAINVGNLDEYKHELNDYYCRFAASVGA